MQYFCVFLLFYTFALSQGNVIKGQEWTYSYKGQIDTSSSACNQSLARWTISGTLIGQSFDKYMVFKMENLKTSLFNGDINDLKSSEEKNIPSEAEILYKPFVIHKNNDDITIDVTPNEPLWSLNMKRAIGSHFQINFDRGFDGEFTEHSLYGDCSINYMSDKIGKDIVVNKIINHDKCKNNPFKHKTNVKKAEPMENYEPVKIETVKKYYLKDVNSILVVSDTYSFSNISYKPMPILPYSQDIHQYQEFKMISQSKIEKVINIDENTEKHKITYEIDMESLYGRQKKSTPEKQIKELFENFEIFDKEFNSTIKLACRNCGDPKTDLQLLQHFDINKEDRIENMFLLLANMKTDTLSKINGLMKDRQDLFNITYLTLLPYIGTIDTTNYIIDLLKNDFLHYYEGSEYLGVKFLATFPKYIENPTEELIKKFEFLLDLETNEILKNAAILSFTNILKNAFTKKTVSNDKIREYRKMFYEKYQNATEYEMKMTYLLSLVNIGDILETNFILNLLINTSEPHNLRALGITAFKNRLVYYSEMTFEKIWPLVKNETESFDVRVAALDFLLSSNLNREEFYEIVDLFRKPQKGINNKHLFHYFHTSMITLQNTTRYTDPLGELATELFQNEEFRDFRLNTHSWLTSKFRFAYTDKDPNYGRNFEGKLVADPKTNTINTIELSYNHFIMSFDMGTYNIYLKFDNFFESRYKKKIINKLIDTDITISDLLDLIKKFNIEMKNEDIQFHFEVVIFVDHQAILSIYVNQDNTLKMEELILDGLDFVEDKQEKRVSYPLIDYIAFPSDLGTPLTIKNDIQDIFASERLKIDLNFRNYWYHQIWMEAYNPIVGTPIASYKYYGYEISLNILIDLSIYHQTLAVYHTNNSFQYVYDKIIGTSVESEEVLKTYCAECEKYYEIPNDDYLNEKIEKYGLLSLTLNRTRGKHILFTNTSNEYMYNFIDSHQSNADSLTIAKPFLLFLHLFDHEYYFQNELTKGLYRTIPYYQNTTMSLFKLKNNYKENIAKEESMQASNYQNYSLEFSSSGLIHDEVKLHWDLNFAYRTIIENMNEKDKPKIPQSFLNFDFDFVIYNETRFKAAIERKLVFPNLNEDKFSITPVKPTEGGIVIRFCDLPEDASDCLTNSTIIAREKFWLSDKRKKSILESEDYKTCEKQKSGLKFTPPTKSCVLYSHTPLHEYDNYEMFAGYYNISQESQEFEKPALTYSMTNQHTMKIGLLKKPLTIYDDEEKPYWNKTINYWHLLTNPNAISYNDYGILFGVTRSCIITPRKIKTLTGTILDFDQNKPVALIECLKKPLRGLTVQEIDDKHVGFKFWALNNQVTATVVDGNLIITLNGNEVKNTFYDEENKVKIIFLSKNVIYIYESEVEIYYNTEYLLTKMKSQYSSTLCGFCTSAEN